MSEGGKGMEQKVKLTKRQAEALSALAAIEDSFEHCSGTIRREYECISVSLRMPGNEPGPNFSERLAYPHLNALLRMDLCRRVYRGAVLYAITPSGRSLIAKLKAEGSW